ncbi:MAG: phage major capsid protein [Defluviitaleaceae bacterium]|nr:phage major capsid protein [Defluviitaleaceae bacterium]
MKKNIKMNLQFFSNDRVQEIEARFDAIAHEIEARGDELTVEQMTAFSAEIATLKTERSGLQTGLEQRNALLASIGEGRAAGSRVVQSFPNPAAVGESRSAETADITESIEYRTAFMNNILRGTEIPEELRADATTSTTDVGSVIPAPVLNRIIEKMEAVGMILPLVTRTSYKGGLGIPISTVKPVATWVGEGEGSDKQKLATGNVSFNYFKLRCKVAVSFEVDVMSLAIFETMLVNAIVKAMVKAMEQAIISGDGVGKPTGILTETPPAEQEIEVDELTYETLTEAEGALPVEYENDAVWCMTKKTFMRFLSMTDATGQPIARVDYGIGGKPMRILLGRSVVLCNYLATFSPTVAAGTKFAFLFDFSDYIFNTNFAMGIKKYMDNDNDDQVTRAITLADGKVVDNGSLVVLKKAAS